MTDKKRKVFYRVFGGVCIGLVMAGMIYVIVDPITKSHQRINSLEWTPENVIIFIFALIGLCVYMIFWKSLDEEE